MTPTEQLNEARELLREAAKGLVYRHNHLPHLVERIKTFLTISEPHNQTQIDDQILK